MRPRAVLRAVLVTTILAGSVISCAGGSTPVPSSPGPSDSGPAPSPSATAIPTDTVSVVLDPDGCHVTGPSTVADGTLVRFEFETVLGDEPDDGVLMVFPLEDDAARFDLDWWLAEGPVEPLQEPGLNVPDGFVRAQEGSGSITVKLVHDARFGPPEQLGYAVSCAQWTGDTYVVHRGRLVLVAPP